MAKTTRKGQAEPAQPTALAGGFVPGQRVSTTQAVGPLRAGEKVTIRGEALGRLAVEPDAPDGRPLHDCHGLVPSGNGWMVSARVLAVVA